MTATARTALHADARGPQKGGSLFNLIRLVHGRYGMLALTTLSGILAQGGALAAMGLGAWLVGRAVTGTAAHDLIAGFWGLGVIATATAVARWWQAFVSHDFAFALIETLQVGIYDGLERAAPGAVLGRRTGELASVATGDAELLEFFYAHTVADYVGATLVPLVALVFLANIHPWAALALLPFVLLVASVPFWLARRAGEQGREVMERLGHLNAETVDMIQGLRELAIFGRTRDFLGRLMTGTGLLAIAQRRYGVRAGLEQAAIDVLTESAVLCAALVGLMLLARGEIERASFPLIVVLAGGALMPIAEVTQTARKLGELRAGAARVLAIFSQRAAVQDAGPAAKPADATVRFEQVGFAYGAERGAVLDCIDFSVRPNETVALVGHSGAGKSTCANLLMRFWDVSAGRISIGGHDLRDLPLGVLRQLVAYVPQDVHLFNETVADNIRLGRPQASMAEVERAARLAQAHDFIVGFPDGYATACGERGARLSGGQRQRIAIARALLVAAPVLVLDEASSSLDAESEQALQVAMEHVRRDRAVLVIAHRLDTIRSADRIIVLDGGRIVEQGRHEDLLAARGRYAALLDSAGEASC